ncbi:hypothetical protein [Micromonospora sp. NPDC005710]|uniref:WXG100 family type VII secretion target n=1 Tax=Micromonospora sp. NPDC005710 TaxID=3157051 RepID=UPI0033C979FA
MAGGTWERCVREVTLSADPETVGSVGAGWSNLSSGLQQLRDALVGRSFVGPIATGQERPHVGGLPGMLAGWKGSGGDAYREHLGKIGKQIEDLITDATNVSGALTRIEGDIRKSVSTIPIPLMDDFGWNEWSLPNGTELDDARDGESSSGFLAALRKDYQSNPGSYADGAFRDKADDLEATMKVDGQAGDQKRGGWWDTGAHLDNWYRDNQEAANTAMAPLPQAVYTERPKLTVVPPNIEDGPVKPFDQSNLRRDTSVPPTGRPDIAGGEFGGKPEIGGGGPTIGSRPPGIGDTGGPTSTVDPFSPTKPGGIGDGSLSGGTGQLTSPSTGSTYPGSDAGYSSGLAGASPSGVGGLGGGIGGGGVGSAGLGGAGGGFGGGAGVGSAGGIGAGGGVGGGAGIGVGGIPGMVGGGNGKLPPMTSAANALRTAAGAGGAGMAGGARGAGGAGVMGGGLAGGAGGAGGAGHGGGTGSEHSSWLTEDDDPWGPGDGASPGILR